jgi:hypothetical protein
MEEHEFFEEIVIKIQGHVSMDLKRLEKYTSGIGTTSY